MAISKKYLNTNLADPNHAASKTSNWIDRDQEVLEVGCASGVHTRHLKERLGCRVTGIEIDPIAAEDARPHCESLIIGSIEELDLPQALGDRLFDVIMFVDVLEHLVNSAGALKRVRPFLKSNGILIASIPNIAHAAVCWELAHGRFDYRKYGLLDDTHVRFFTKKNVSRLFEDAGYRIVSWDRVVKTPQETEFNVHCYAAQDQAFLDWICELNPEAHTYQFLVKAQLAPDCLEQPLHEALEVRDSVIGLEARVEDLTRQNLKLRSQLAWLDNHRFGALTGLIDRLRNKRRK